MGFPICRNIVSLMWCIMECLLIAGMLNGWIWMKSILKDEEYFLHTCKSNKSVQVMDNPYNDDMFIPGIVGGEINKPFTISHDGKKMKCIYRRVLKVLTLEEYAAMQPTDPTVLENEDDVDYAKMQDNKSCANQDSHLELVITIVTIISNTLLLPLGVVLDKYGTCRTRILAMCGTAVGSLTMLFSSEFYPWLIFPALLTLGLSGSLVLLTDLQVANLFGGRRYTVMSIFVGAYFSGGIVIFFMKLTKASGVSLQTSFMFTTIGIVPVLISTIAMLPKSRIPWPLPAEYRKSKSANNADKNKAWQRRMSVGPKKKMNMCDFWTALKSKLFILCVVWFSLLSLKIRMFDITLEMRLQQTYIPPEASKYMSWYAIVLLLSLPLSPFIGLVMDWRSKQVSIQPHVVQMRNIFNAMCIQHVIAIISSVTSLFPNIYIQVVSYIFTTIEKVSLHAVMFAFLMHVNFPSEHFGKLAGIVLSISGVTLILQFPLKLLTEHALTDDDTYTYLIPLVLLLVSGLHPFSVWYHCRTGNINNSAGTNCERDKTLTVVLMEPSTTKSSCVEGKIRDNDGRHSGDIDSRSECTETTKLQITDL